MRVRVRVCLCVCVLCVGEGKGAVNRDEEDVEPEELDGNLKEGTHVSEVAL